MTPRSPSRASRPPAHTFTKSRPISTCRETCSPVSRSRSKRSEEHTSELQSLMRISYAVFCLKKKKINTTTTSNTHHRQKNTKLLTSNHRQSIIHNPSYNHT